MDLTTTYMGMTLRSPIVASAGTIQKDIDGIRALSDSGVGAITMFSLFEEQIRAAADLSTSLVEDIADSNPEAGSYFSNVAGSKTADDVDRASSYLAHLEEAVSVSEVPVIASLNGSTRGGWTHFAKRMESAGAAGIELNIYYIPGDDHISSLEVENLHIDIVSAVKATVDIPVAVKLSPYFSSFFWFANRIVAAGVDALVMFNRFFQPDIDLERMELTSGVKLSQVSDAQLPRTWISLLRNHVNCSLAATSGVETVDEVIKYLVSGADIICTTSALIRHGAGYATTLISELEEWLKVREFSSVSEARGIFALPAEEDGLAFTRSEYVKALDKANGWYSSLDAL